MADLEEAIEFLKLSQEAESINRANGLEWMQFRNGEQWPSYATQSRGNERPKLTINKTDSYCTKVENQQRQQRPRIKVSPTNGQATKKIADILKGMIRHIELARGGGDLSYDTAFGHAVTMGWGYYRVMADYVRDDSFEKECYLAPVINPFTVNFDPNSTLPDGSDQDRCLISDVMTKTQFKLQYPGADSGANFSPGDRPGYADWVQKEDIRIGEFFKVDQEKKRLVMLSDGMITWEDRLPESAVLERAGISVVGDRESFRRKILWRKQTALEVIDEQTLPGRWIPVVPVYGTVTVIAGKKRYSGLVKNAKDPQIMLNFWRTATTESIALAPKAKWLMEESQDENHENEWLQANLSPKPVLKYKATDINGQPAPPPQRLQPEPPPEGMIQAAFQVDQDLSSVLGIIEPGVRTGGVMSGKALNAERMESDQSNYHFYDNLTRSIRHTGVILLDWIPHYYNKPRIVRIVGDDGKPDTTEINQQNPSPGPDTPGPVEAILNDVTVGEYDVVMDTGPGYNTKRQEAVNSMMPLFEKNEKLMEQAGDIMFRNMDFPGSEVIADRLAAMNPLSQIDEKSDISPQAQTMIKALQQQLQQAQQMMQGMQLELKHRAGIESMKQEGETKRALIKSTADIHVEGQENEAWMHEVASRDSTKRYDTDVRAQTTLSAHEIDAVRELLKTRVNNAHDMIKMEKVSEQEDRELKQAE